MRKVSYKLLIPGLPYKTVYGGFGYSSVSLIRDGHTNILFDVGHYAVRSQMIKFLKRYKINKVFISHLHYDHCLNIDLFLNKGISVYLNKKEWDYLNNITSKDIYTFRLFNKIVKRSDIILFDKDFNISENVRVLETIGHTAGHSSLAFNRNGKKYIVAGDAIKTFKDFKIINKSDVSPYNYRKFIATKKYIISNFDIIIPGHSNLIENGKYVEEKLSLKSF